MNVFDMRDAEYGQLQLDLQQIEGPEWTSLDFTKKMALITKVFERGAAKREQELIEQGIKIFAVKEVNDDTSVEADYGAPSLGLDFYASLLESKRAYRYTPMELVEHVYKTHTHQARQVGRTLKAQGYKIFNGEKPETLPSQIHFSNGGVTRAFSDIVDLITKRFVQTAPLREKYGMKQSGAILVPVPTYGLFLYRLHEIVTGNNINIIPIQRHDNGSVDCQSLKMKIIECQLENRRLLGFYDSNPQNPTGYIRGREETEAIGEILMDAAQCQLEHDVFFMEAATKDSLEKTGDLDNAINQYLFYSTEEPFGSVMVIDDMAYEGLELVTDKKPYSFGQVSRMLAERTAVLKGISKIGLPGMRIGMTIAHHSLVSRLADEQLTREFSANSFGVDIMAARYGDKYQRAQFKRHEKALRRLHSTRAAYMHAFFRGIDQLEVLSNQDKKRLIRNYAAYANISVAHARIRLNEGLPNFHLPDGPDCGFFQRVNCEALKGRSIAIKSDRNNWPFYAAIETSGMVRSVFKAFHIRTVSAVGQGLPEGSLMVRVSLSISESDLFRFYDQMREMHNYFWGENPEVQLDLFRQKPVIPSPIPG